MLSLRLFVLFIHVTAVIVALGGSLFSTFALAPVLAEELDGPSRVRVARRVTLLALFGAVLAGAIVTARSDDESIDARDTSSSAARQP